MKTVSKAGKEILALVATGGTTMEDFKGGKARAVQALRRGKLISVTQMKIEGLELTPAGQALLEGKSETNGKSKAAASNGEPATHRRGSKASKAAKIIEQFHGKIARGKLIDKLVSRLELSPATASTYIYQHGKASH